MPLLFFLLLPSGEGIVGRHCGDAFADTDYMGGLVLDVSVFRKERIKLLFVPYQVSSIFVTVGAKEIRQVF